MVIPLPRGFALSGDTMSGGGKSKLVLGAMSSSMLLSESSSSSSSSSASNFSSVSPSSVSGEYISNDGRIGFSSATAIGWGCAIGLVVK
jgi:hypothetical protein